MPNAQSIQERLLLPFEDSAISEIDGFSYVDPYHYRMRWHEIFVQGFTFKVYSVVVGQDYITAQAYFKGSVDDCEFEIDLPCAEKLIKSADEAKKLLKFEQSMNMLVSAGCKTVSRELGIGLHLYQKVATVGSKKGGQSQPRATASNGAAAPTSAPVANGTWDGSELITFGKHNGKPWNDPIVDNGYLTWCVGKGQASAVPAQAELNRRAAGNVAAGVAQAAQAAPPPAAPAPATDTGRFPVPF